MPLIPLNKVHNHGIIKDLEDFELPLTAFSEGKNVRFDGNKVSSTPGYSEVYTGVNAGDGPLFHMPWREGSDIWWLYHTGDKIYRMNDVGHTDVSQSGGYSGSSAHIYNGFVFNGVPIMNVSTFTDYPQQWDASATGFADLSNWTTNLYCKGMGSFENFVFAYNLKDGSDEYPMAIQWSHPADPGAVPTSWDYTDPTKLAGRTPLAKTEGSIVSFGTLRDFAMVYKDDAFVRCDFIGGQFVFDFNYVSTERGIVGPHAWGLFRSNHFVVSRGDFLLTDGNTIEVMGVDKNVRYFFNTVNAEYLDQTIVVPYHKQQELIIFYVNESEDQDSTTPNFMLIWNWRYNTWTYRSLGHDIDHATSGLVETDPGDIIDSQTQIIDTDDSIIDTQVATTKEEDILLADETNEKFYLLDDTNQFDGTDYTSEIERTGLAIAGVDENNEPMVDNTRNKFLTRVYPMLEATGSVDFYFGVQRILHGAVDWQGPYSFDPSTDRFIDLRLNGKYLAYRITSPGTTSWEFRGMMMELKLLGQANR